MLAPTLTLWFLVIACGVASTLGPESTGMPKRASMVASVALPLVVATWVMADARKRGRKVCYDSFVYFAWPVVVPVYLFQTRGVRAFLTLLCFAGLWLMSALAAGVVAILRELLS